MLNKPSLLVFFFLAAVGFCAFYPGLRAGFVADDYVWLERCRHLSELNIFNTSSFAFVKGRPGALLIFSLLYRIFGLNAAGFHVVILFFHVLNAFLVFIILQRVQTVFYFNLLVPLIFLVHFSNEETVFWIASLSSIFCLFFGLCAVLCYLEWLNGFQSVHRVLAIFFSALAMSTREDGLMLPLYLCFIGFLFITDQAKGFSKFCRLFKRNLVFFIPLLIFLLLRVSSAAKDPGPYAFTMNPLIWIKNLAYFVLHLTLPIRYFFDQLGYGWHDRLHHSFSSPNWLAAIGLGSTAFLVLSWFLKKRMNITIPTSFKAGIVLSSIGLLPYLPLDGNSPRFLYFSLIGGSFLVVSIILLATGRISKTAVRRMAIIAGSIAFVSISGMVLWERGDQWVISGQVARSLVEDVRRVVLNNLDAKETIYVANLPITKNGAYIFNPGNFEAALSLTAPDVADRVEDIGRKSPDELKGYKDRRIFTFQNDRIVKLR